MGEQMKQKTILSGMLLAVFMSGCASEADKRAEFFSPQMPTGAAAKTKKAPAKPPFTRAEAERAIGDVVVHRFALDSSGELKAPVDIVFLSIGPNRGDPDTAFLKHVTGKNPKVLPSSAAVRSRENLFVEEKTGKRGIPLRIERVEWIDYYQVQVDCSWLPNAGKELSFVYQLAWKKGKWEIN